MFNVYSFSIWESSELWKKGWTDVISETSSCVKTWSLLLARHSRDLIVDRLEPTSSPGLFLQKMGGPIFEEKALGTRLRLEPPRDAGDKDFFQSLQRKKMVWSVYKFFFSLGNTVLINKGKRNYCAQQQQSSVFTTCTGMCVWLAWFWFCVSIDSAIRSPTCLLYWFWWSDSP